MLRIFALTVFAITNFKDVIMPNNDFEQITLLENQFQEDHSDAVCIEF